MAGGFRVQHLLRSFLSIVFPGVEFRWIPLEEKVAVIVGLLFFDMVLDHFSLNQINPFHQIRVMLVSKEENLLNLPIIFMLVVLYLLGYQTIKIDNSNSCIQSNIDVPVDAKRLQLTGLTSDAGQDSAVSLTQEKKGKQVFKFGGASSSSSLPAIGAGDAGPSVRAGEVAPPSPDVEEITVAPTASLSLPGGLPPNFIMDEEKKCASSSLLPTTSKIEELRDIAHTWNEHYVGLKDAYLVLLERLRAAEDAASESKTRGF